MSQKLTDLEIPFFFVRKPGQGSIMLRVEADSREMCQEILDKIVISGDSSKFRLLKLDKYPKEISVCIVVEQCDEPCDSDEPFK